MNEANNTSASVDKNVNTGDIVECTVEQIMPYGAFVKIAENGKKGMIHISEISHSFVKDINEVLKVSENIQAKVIKIDDRGRIDLSLKQATMPSQSKFKKSQQPQKFQKRTPPVISEVRENFRKNDKSDKNNKAYKPEKVRDFYEMREKFREDNPEEADSFEKKIASFLKVSDAKITDLNTRNSARSGRNQKRRSNNKEH